MPLATLHDQDDTTKWDPSTIAAIRKMGKIANFGCGDAGSTEFRSIVDTGLSLGERSFACGI
jgi:hypothetical protein